MSDLHVIATLPARADRAKQALAVIVGAIDEIRSQDGCRSYSLFEDRDHPGQFFTYEIWRDEAALNAHLRSAVVTAMGSRLQPMLSGEPVVTKLDAIDMM